MSRRLVLRWLGVGVLALGGLAVSAEPAFAHAELLSTEPVYGAKVAVSMERVVVRYDLPVDVRGADVTLVDGSGRRLRVGRPAFASADHRDVALPMPKLAEDRYLLKWFLFGTDGDVMGGELEFTVVPESALAGPLPGGALGPSLPGMAAPGLGARPVVRLVALTPLAGAQDFARLLGFVSLAVLVGGVTFVAGLWRNGAVLTRSRVLLGGALGVALLATATNLGLKGAAVSGRSAWAIFSPAALTALEGTHVGRVLAVRLAFFALAVPVVAVLLANPTRALRSIEWRIGAVIAGGGAIVTHGMLSHAATKGPLPMALDAVHLSAITTWLGGLTFLGIVVLPRRQVAELASITPRFSRLAFRCVTTAVVAGTVLLVLISPRWSAIPTSSYGRFLLLKLALVAGLLVIAQRARKFVQGRLPELSEPSAGKRVLVTVGGTTPTLDAPATAPAPESSLGSRAAMAGLGPFVSAVTAELCIGASILAVTAALVGRAPPS